MSIYTSTKVLPYVYLLTHKITKQFYYGYRYANKVPSNQDFGIFYFASSKVIKEMGFENFEFEIIAEFINPDKKIAADEAWDFEQSLIRDNWVNPLILNDHCVTEGGQRFRKTGPTKQSTRVLLSAAAKARKPHSPTKEARAANGRAHKGMKRNTETKKAMSDAQKGHTRGRGVKMTAAALESHLIAVRKYIYTIVSPLGVVYTTTDMKGFCVLHNLLRQRLHGVNQLLKPKIVDDRYLRKAHKHNIGWQCISIVSTT